MKEPTKSESELFKAVIDSNEVTIEEAIRKGVDPNCVDSFTGKTPLYIACLRNRMHAIEALLRHGADPNKRFTYRSPVDKRVEKDMVALHYATSSETVAALLKAGADVNVADANGTTVLMRAAFHGHVDVVKALLAAGASPSVRQQKSRDKKAHTARELVEFKIELWKKLKNQSRQQAYEEVHRILLDAESRPTAS
jgi:ankyrin repeat protein